MFYFNHFIIYEKVKNNSIWNIFIQITNAVLMNFERWILDCFWCDHLLSTATLCVCVYLCVSLDHRLCVCVSLSVPSLCNVCVCLVPSLYGVCVCVSVLPFKCVHVSVFFLCVCVNVIAMCVFVCVCVCYACMWLFNICVNVCALSISLCLSLCSNSNQKMTSMKTNKILIIAKYLLLHVYWNNR